MTDREHVEQLAAELGVEVEFTAERFGGRINHVSRIAWLEPIKGDEDDEAYPVALHELGHVAATQLFPWGTAERLANEAYAWLWALEHLRRPMTDTIRLEAAGGMGSYLRAGTFPEAEGADAVRAVLELIGPVEMPWPKTGAAYQRARDEYLGVTA